MIRKTFFFCVSKAFHRQFLCDLEQFLSPNMKEPDRPHDEIKTRKIKKILPKKNLPFGQRQE